MAVGPLLRPEYILQPPDMGEAGDIEPVGVAGEAHGADEVALVQRKATVWHHPDQEELTGLVGGESEAHLVQRQPLREATRGGDAGCGLGLAGLR